MEEIWAPVPTLETRYSASNLGRIKNTNTDKILSSNNVHTPCVSIVNNSKIHVFEVKLLVYSAFNDDVDIWSSPKPKIENVNGDVKDTSLANLRLVNTDDLPGEIWKDIVGFENCYQVSNKGRIKRLPRHDTYVRKDTGLTCVRNVASKIVKPTITSGYYEVNLHYHDKNKYVRIHRAVAEAFIPVAKDIQSLQVNHIDGNKLNNCVENLEWCSCSENITHAVRTGLRIDPPKGVRRPPVRVCCIETNQLFESKTAAAKALGISPVYLSERILHNQPCHGYHFKLI